MAVHIKDDSASTVVRKRTATRKISTSEAVSADKRAEPIDRRLAELHATIRSARLPGEQGQAADDKAFFDEQWERGL